MGLCTFQDSFTDIGENFSFSEGRYPSKNICFDQFFYEGGGGGVGWGGGAKSYINAVISK